MNINILDLTFRPYIPQLEIEQKVTAMGRQITEDYRDKTPFILSVLNGSFIFTADLVRAIDLPCETEFVKLKSYEGTQSTEQIQEMIGLERDIKGLDIIIVEDIVDTGLTLYRLIENLKLKEPKSIAIASLIFKKEAFKKEYAIDYVGFEIENKFIVGYGLDYNGYGRNLKEIYQIV